MAYNYFVCRRHVPPVRTSAPQPANLPDTYASPMCPSCGKTMQRYDTGLTPVDNRPLPPPLPPALALDALPALAVIYEGSEMNPGHGLVTWKVSRSQRKAYIHFDIKLGHNQGGAYDSCLEFKMADGLLDVGQPDPKCDWLVGPPMRGATANVWHRIRLIDLLGGGKPASLPDTIDVVVKLGNAAFGLIHLLAGHSQAVRNIGPYTIPAQTDKDDNKYVTLLALQSGMARFENNYIRQINFDDGKRKLLIRGAHNGLIVLTEVQGSLWSLTTIYNTSAHAFGTTIYTN